MDVARDKDDDAVLGFLEENCEAAAAGWPDVETVARRYRCHNLNVAFGNLKMMMNRR